MRCDPTASFHRLPNDSDQPPIGKLVNTAGDLVGWQLPQRTELLVHGAGAAAAGKNAVSDAMRDDCFMRCPDFQ